MYNDKKILTNRLCRKAKLHNKRLNCSQISRNDLETKLMEQYHKVHERNNTDPNKCDYCSLSGENDLLFTLPLGSDLNTLKLIHDASDYHIYCCKDCAPYYMSTFDYLLINYHKPLQISTPFVELPRSRSCCF